MPKLIGCCIVFFHNMRYSIDEGIIGNKNFLYLVLFKKYITKYIFNNNCKKHAIHLPSSKLILNSSSIFSSFRPVKPRSSCRARRRTQVHQTRMLQEEGAVDLQQTHTVGLQSKHYYTWHYDRQVILGTQPWCTEKCGYKSQQMIGESLKW